MRNQNIEMNILIGGKRAAAEYRSPRNGQLYIEGRDGSEFEIEIINRNSFAVEAIVSVDGLSVTTGEAAGDQSRGYIVDANDRMVIPGWKLDDKAAAKFQFSGRKGGSYAEQSAEGSAANKGVIGLMVFEEKVARNDYNCWGNFGGILLSNGIPAPYSGTPKGFMVGSTSDSFGGYAQTYANNASLCASTAATCASTAAASAQAAYTYAQTAATSATSSATNASTSTSWASTEISKSAFVAEPEVKQTLGTAFGDETGFRTSEAEFIRGDMIVAAALFYDDRRGLEKRGIIIERRQRKQEPNPFPALAQKGCQPPAGWTVEREKPTRRRKAPNQG